jgi:hypothetical protein
LILFPNPAILPPARIFESPWFSRFAAKEGISDGELRDVVAQLEQGTVYANLGGGVYKQRLADNRVLLFFRSGDRAFFHYGFAKADRENITPKELRDMKKFARDILSWTVEELEAAVKAGRIKEIKEQKDERQKTD